MHTESDAAAPGAAVRAGWATAAAGTTTGVLLRTAGAMLTGALPEGQASAGALAGLRVDELVGLAAVTVGAIAAAALTAGCILLVATALAPGRWAEPLARWTRRLTPAVLRRAVAVGLGAGLGLIGPVGMAGATEIDLGWAVTTQGAETGADVAATEPAATSLPSSVPADAPVAAPTTGSPGPAPDAVVAQVAAPAPTGGAPEPGVATVTVTSGDSLWSIAAAHLPPDASDAQVATEWPRWYAANRALIGTDPGLVLPGQVLVAPGAPQVTP